MFSVCVVYTTDDMDRGIHVWYTVRMRLRVRECVAVARNEYIELVRARGYLKWTCVYI